MQIMKILIVEDDASIAKNLAERIEQLELNHIEMVGIAYTEKEAMLSIIDKEPNLVLLDIQLQDDKEGGIKVGTFIRNTHADIGIVYITALPDEECHAQILPTNPLDFLKKPYDQDSLKRALDHAYYQFRNGGRQKVLPNSYRIVKANRGDVLWLNLGMKSTKRTKVDNIMRIETQSKHIHIFLEDEFEAVEIKTSLKSFQEGHLCYYDCFIQIHKQYLINSEFIDKINWVKDEVMMIGLKEPLSIGAKYKEAFRQYIDNQNLW